jgi:hypothetical protein
MIKSLLIFCTATLLVFSCYAQSFEPKEGEFPKKPGVILSTNFLSLFEPEGGPTVGVEFRTSLNWAFGLDAMAIAYNMPFLFDYDDSNHHGYRLSPQIKYYFAGKKSSYRGYIGLMGMYKSVSYTTMSGSYGHYDDVTGNYVYTEPERYKRNKYATAGSINIGFQKFLDRDNHIFFEFFGGVGLRYQWRKGKPSFADAVPDYDEEYREGIKDGVYPHMTAGIKLGYRF